MSYKADSILKNQIFNFSMQILNIIFPLIAIPYTTRLFGPELLGEVNFANSIVQYFMIAAIAGIPVYATREIARSRDDNNDLKKTFKEIAMLQAIFTGISFIVYIVFIFSVKNIRNDIYIYILRNTGSVKRLQLYMVYTRNRKIQICCYSNIYK